MQLIAISLTVSLLGCDCVARLTHSLILTKQLEGCFDELVEEESVEARVILSFSVSLGSMS